MSSSSQILIKKKQLRRSVFNRDGFKCFWCDKPLISKTATVDHIIPKSKGGLFEYGNLVTSCEKCNRKRADKDAVDWLVETMYGPCA